MPYVYRYIDISKFEVIYIGKVTGFKDVCVDPLENRHNQHKRDEWYKRIGEDNIVMQYIELDSHTDADIYETWLISYYDTGQLMNKAKTQWGCSKINLNLTSPNLWKTYDDILFGFNGTMDALMFSIRAFEEYFRKIRELDAINDHELYMRLTHDNLQKQERSLKYREKMQRFEYELLWNDFKRQNIH